ncbi:MAG TPA: hypothetical protein VH478_24770 [Trebonia sp.]|nr:hypothetical protein [Trebonia sp.]
MKQVQQLRLMDQGMAVVELNDKADFSRLSRNETLYFVSHGYTGAFMSLDKADVVRWLTDTSHGVPRDFGGIVALSCYSGDGAYTLSLAKYLAAGLHGRVAAGTTVEGATGYSFGTPEFRKSRRSSVLVDLAFYAAQSITDMVDEWLKLKPTHDQGVLHAKLGAVDQGKTIEQQLTAAQKTLGKSANEVATDYIKDFAVEAKRIEQKLKDLLAAPMKGATVAERAEYLIANGTNQDVIDWNTAIDQQYALFSDLYLWKPQATAFAVEHVA